MPDDKETAHIDCGPAATSSICHLSGIRSVSEEHTALVPANPSENITTISESPAQSLSNCSYYTYPNTHPTFDYIATYNPCVSSDSNYSSKKADLINQLFCSTHSSTEPFKSSEIQPSEFSPSVHSSFSINSYNSNITNSDNNSSNSETIPNSRVQFKDQEDFDIQEEVLNFQSYNHLLPTAISFSKVPKLNSVSLAKSSYNPSEILFPSPPETEIDEDKEKVDVSIGKNTEYIVHLEGGEKILKAFKDDNFEEVDRNNTKIKSSQDVSQELMTDSFLHLLQRKNFQDNFSYDGTEISPLLVSLTSKYMSGEVSESKKKENNEDLKLMNEFLAKIILDKEEKRFRAIDEKKQCPTVIPNSEPNERKLKRDAMSHYQDEKNHKRTSNYGDYNQWEYFGQQDIQSSNSLNRRGHFSFGNASQQHAVGWNQMGIGLPRQASPYYSNPHSHMMPAHAHSDYRFNQWNNPNHKNVPNVHNAHSHNNALPQAKIDINHHSDISNAVQDFGLSISSTSEFSKFRPTSRELMRRTSPSISEKSLRPGVRPNILATISSGMKNSTLRPPPISSHPKTVINNPLSDLQMLVTNQDGENPPQKSDSFQQESVDLSAHSDLLKQKDNPEDEASSVHNKNSNKGLKTSVSVIQIQNKHVKSDVIEYEKPVELTSKNSEKNSEPEVPPPLRGNTVDSKKLSSGCVTDSKKESASNEDSTLSGGVKTSVIVGKIEESPVCITKNEADIPKGVESKGEEEKENVESKDIDHDAKEKKTVEEYFSKNNTAEEKKPEEPKNSAETSPEKSKNVSKAICEDMDSTKQSKRRAEDEQLPCEKKKVLLEIEPQLLQPNEKVQEENVDSATVTSTSTDARPVVNEIPKKTPKKKPSKKSKMGRLSSGQSSGSERSLTGKKSRSLGSKEDSRKKMKKSLCDVMERRGPFLHVMGSRESPASVTLVNFPKGDDEDEKDKTSAKKQLLNANRTKHHNELDYRGRSKNGLYCSTLSARYDAHTTDYTWICVFCKKGPHYNTMGDLFGPYIISEDENVSLGDFSGDEKDISDAQKRGGRNKKSLRSNNMVEHFQKMSKKLRKTQSSESCLTGMTVISDDQVNQLRYEVWVHEQCAVWSPNVFLIGARIIGMQEAIWCSVKTMCSKCGITGANIGCVYRNCPNRSHYHCAKECGWSLQQETFISTCHIHKPRS